MTVYRNEEQEEKINEAYKKVLEGDKEKIDEILKDKENSFKWTKGVNEAYGKVLENEKGAEKMVAALEKKSGKKYSPEEKAKLIKKFMANMKEGKLVEQTYLCSNADCGHSFHSSWKDADTKCRKCGSTAAVKGK